MLLEAVAKIGESNIKTDCDKFADKMFEEHLFQKISKKPTRWFINLKFILKMGC